MQRSVTRGRGPRDLKVFHVLNNCLHSNRSLMVVRFHGIENSHTDLFIGSSRAGVRRRMWSEIRSRGKGEPQSLTAEPQWRTGEIRKGSTQLIHVLFCSVLMHGIEADVNWYTGGNSYVTLPTAVAENRPGIYLANAKFNRMKDLPEEDQGPQTAIASITRLRWLGARNEFLKIATCPNSVRQLGKNKHDRLMEMLNANCDSSEVEDVE